MNNLTKMVFVIILALIALPTVASAETKVSVDSMKETAEPNIYYDEEAGMYYDTKSEGYIGEVYRVSGTDIKKVDVEDYIEVETVDLSTNLVSPTTLNKNGNYQSSILAGPTDGTTYNYIETSNVEHRMFGSRASLIQENPGPGEDKFSISYNASKSSQFNVGLSSREINGISAGVGYTYVSSESISSSHQMSIPAGYSGYWRFDPRMRETRGTLKEYQDGWYVGEQYIRGYYPTRVSWQLDGWLVAVKNPL